MPSAPPAPGAHVAHVRPVHDSPFSSRRASRRGTAHVHGGGHRGHRPLVPRSQGATRTRREALRASLGHRRVRRRPGARPSAAVGPPHRRPRPALPRAGAPAYARARRRLLQRLLAGRHPLRDGDRPARRPGHEAPARHRAVAPRGPRNPHRQGHHRRTRAPSGRPRRAGERDVPRGPAEEHSPARHQRGAASTRAPSSTST